MTEQEIVDKISEFTTEKRQLEERLYLVNQDLTMWVKELYKLKTKEVKP